MKTLKLFFVIILFIFSFGFYSFSFAVDDTVTVSVVAPDLVASPESAPASITANTGVPITFTSTVTNRGNTSTGGTFQNFFIVTNGFDGAGTWTEYNSPTTTLGPIGAGGTSTFSRTHTFASVGNYSFQACTDLTTRVPSMSGGVINEGSNEGNNCSWWTNVVVSGPPVPPTGLTATTGSCTTSAGTGTITVSWNPVADATSYTILADGSSMGNISSTSFVHPGLTLGSPHTYQVRANNAGGSSSYTSSVTGTASNLCQYLVSTSVSSGPGSFSPTSANVYHGATTSFVLTPSAGYAISTVSGCGGTRSGNTYTTGAITSACTVTASFAVGDSCGSANGVPQQYSDPSGAAACSTGAYANSPADNVSLGTQAWNWSCGTVTNCSSPKFGCRTTTDTNYPSYGVNYPNNNAGCASTCLNGAADYPTCTSVNYTLTINYTGSGSGSASPAGSYLNGTVVNLSASPSVGSSFSGWYGDADCSDGAVTMNTNKTCTAAFTAIPGTPVVTVSPSSIAYGASTNVSFTSTNAYYCFLSLDFTTPYKWEGYYASRPASIPTGAMNSSGTHTASVVCANTDWSTGGWGSANFTVGTDNAAPNAPTITTGTNDIYPNALQSFNFTATDPDGDQVQYGVDWNNDGTIESADWTSLGASGFVATMSNSWTSTGAKTFKAMTRDSKGKLSSWTTYNFTVVPWPVPPITTFQEKDNKTQIELGGVINLIWSSEGATSCAMTSLQSPAVNSTDLNRPISNPKTYNPVLTSTYSLVCNGPGGNSPVKNITIRVGDVKQEIKEF